MGETRMGSAWHWRLKWKHFAARQEDPLWLSRSQGEIDLGDPENLEILPLFVRNYIQYIDKEIGCFLQCFQFGHSPWLKKLCL
jgi:hypothetical protein